MAYNITFIGAGNMASAIFGGMIDSGYPADAITATSPSDDMLAPLRERYGILTETDNTRAVDRADVVVLAVKPQIMREVCLDLRDAIQARKPLVVSVAAGLEADTLEQWLGGDLAVIRCMPNTPCLVGSGASGLFANVRVSEAQRDLANELLGAVGLVEWVEKESLLEAVTAVSGSGPAYFFLVFEAMEEAGVAMGLPRETARRLALQTGLGAARMAQLSSDDPAQLKRNVISPQGSTERAIHHFEQAGLPHIFQQAMQACADRAREMAKDFGQQ
ncbi:MULTISPECIES: pyrroline-5-carboxylate reductase [Halomonadaceae]|uniref:pyrroline-5-carboxylate reductase n=1 Tax=Halomonadaceae TaxID=28256 RepID=UPI001597D3C0|nr:MULTISPECIES: pyrroline-5-carboxylate reductase [Halomonas]QJQ95298.1 pyrroline-5-carboxylate reductase [Halomonas sp. PA5]